MLDRRVSYFRQLYCDANSQRNANESYKSADAHSSDRMLMIVASSLGLCSQYVHERLLCDEFVGFCISKNGSILELHANHVVMRHVHPCKTRDMSRLLSYTNRKKIY